MPLPTRKIGNTDVTAMGYGAMGIAGVYGKPLPDTERYKVGWDRFFGNRYHQTDPQNVHSSLMLCMRVAAPFGTRPTFMGTARTSLANGLRLPFPTLIVPRTDRSGL